MSTLCHSCANEIHEEPVSCRGFCTAVFHLKCCRLPGELLDEINRHSQVFWMCNACAAIITDIRQKKNIKAAYDAGLEKQLSTHTELLGRLKQEILDDLKTEIRSSFAKVSNTALLTPVSSRRSGNMPRIIGSRRLFGKKNNNMPPPMQATGDSVSPSLGNFAVPEPIEKFWIYLSRISRDVTTEQIVELVKNRLNTDDVEVVRLVARNKDVRSMSFISFKAGITMDLKSKALSPSTWPKGMVFREFVDTRKNENFWKPQGQMNLPQTTPNSTSSNAQSPMMEGSQ